MWWRSIGQQPRLIMTTEFLRVKKLHHHQENESHLSLRKRMELQPPELSLAPAPAARSSSSESDGTSRKKRKHHAAGAAWDWEDPPAASLELQLNDPLPLDWEQCLDLQVSDRNNSIDLRSLSRAATSCIAYHARSLVVSSPWLPLATSLINKTTVISLKNNRKAINIIGSASARYVLLRTPIPLPRGSVLLPTWRVREKGN